MTGDTKRPVSFPLRLPASTRMQADVLARKDGLSLNQFINLAVAEKIARLEFVAATAERDQSGLRPELRHGIRAAS